jgi:sugar phosphate isomerase/epimerase
MQRRQFLGLSGAALATGGLARPVLADENRLEAFGVQLSTLNALMLKDFEGTLARVAEIGYRQVEFSAMGFLGRPVEQVQALLAANGLEAPVGRVTPALPENFSTLPRSEAMKIYRARGGIEHLAENVRHSLDGALALGQKYLNLPGLRPDDFRSLDQVKANIEKLVEAGEICAREGVLFGYHNHSWELLPIDGVVPYDLMLSETDSDVLAFQMDSYWIVKGGGGLRDYLRRHPGRFPSCHLKDIDGAGDFADVGDGEIDFPAFVRFALAQGTEHFFVERDNPPEPLQSAQRSYAYLKTMRF